MCLIAAPMLQCRSRLCLHPESRFLLSCFYTASLWLRLFLWGGRKWEVFAPSSLSVKCLRIMWYIDLRPGHAIPRTAEVAYSVAQLWEEIEWMSNNYITRVKTGSQAVGDQTSWREDARLRNMSQRGWAPMPPVEQRQESGKEMRLWPIEWGSTCCSSVQSPTPSHTQHF